LQALGIIPPFELLESTALVEKDGLERLLAYITNLAKRVTNGRLSVLHRHHVTAFVLQIIDNVGDGRVDHLWWACFVQICRDIYIVHGKDPKDPENQYPSSLNQLAKVWVDETAKQQSGLPLLPLHRIEDVILAKLMSERGVRKLWREAFVMLSRHLHVWPEIPLDDTVVEVKTKGSQCRVLNIVSSVTEPERDEDLNGIVKRLVQTSPSPPRLGETPVYTDEKDLVFADFGDFGPDKGFAFLHHPRADLKKSAEETWVSLTWDGDAKRDSRRPPFTGPLTVYLVFMNLHPETAHENRPWLKLDGWQEIEGKRVPTVKQHTKNAREDSLVVQGLLGNGLNNGFPSDRIRGLGMVTPMTEVYRKTFGLLHSQEAIIDLKGMNCEQGSTRGNHLDPVFVFFQVERMQMPDAQSFDDAHYSYFGRSRLYRNLWEFFDKSEVIRQAEVERQRTSEVLNSSRSRSEGSAQLSSRASTQGSVGDGIASATQKALDSAVGSNMIDLTPDGPDLIQAIFLKRYAMEHPPTFEKTNSNLKVGEPELLQLAIERSERHTGKRKCVWFQPMDQEFFIEDMAFVEFDVAEYEQFRFQATMRRCDAGSSTPRGRVKTSVKALALLRNGEIVHRVAPPQEDSSEGGIVIKFKEKTVIDQLNFVTYGQGDDPMRWTISGRKKPTDAWKLLCERTSSYPLDKGSELVEIGKRQAGGIWHHEGNDWLRLRGLWFDAFHELLGALDMQVDRAAAWSLWRIVLSCKHEPIVHQNYPGFVTVADVKTALLQLMGDEPFLSDDLFSWWNVESRLALQEISKRKVYASICAKTPDFHGAPNLVRWVDMRKRLNTCILRSKPYLEKRSATGRTTSSSKQYIVGSLWFEVLYDVVISSMPERYSREEVREYYDAYANKSTGLLPVDRVYDVIAKLGRPGLKFLEFSRFVKNLGIEVDQRSLRLAFNRVDIDQSFTLDADDVECGITLLLRGVLPRQVLQRAGLSTEQIVRHVAFWLLILLVVFFFIVVSFVALLNGKSGAAASGLQSAVAGLAAFGVNSEGSRDTSSAEVHDVVDSSLEASLGSSARLASQKEGGGGSRS